MYEQVHCSNCKSLISYLDRFCDQCGSEEDGQHLTFDPEVQRLRRELDEAEAVVKEKAAEKLLLQQAEQLVLSHEERISHLRKLLLEEQEKLKKADETLLDLSGESKDGPGCSVGEENLLRDVFGAFLLSSDGATIAEIVKDSVASRSGLQPGDELVSVGSRFVKDKKSVLEAISTTSEEFIKGSRSLWEITYISNGRSMIKFVDPSG
jgi:C-terminal processing protease CtpA/Prc